MARRDRMTWNGGAKAAGEQPVLPVERAASAHPATPDEGPAHPAHQPDPEADAYENGDTSSWAEDPTTGPYPNSAHPATPDEGPAHPAYKAATAKEAAEQLRVATERKAAKAIRISQQLLRGLTKDASIIEDQALDLMDIPDSAINSTLGRLAQLAAEDKGKEEEEAAAETVQEEKEEKAKEEKDKKASRRQMSADDRLLRKLLAEEGMDDEDEGDKEATSSRDATSEIMAELKSLRAELAQLKGGCGEYAMDEPVMAQDDDEDVEAMLYSMVQEEMAAEEPEVEEAEVEETEVEAQDVVMDEDMDIDMAPVEDPMDLMDDAMMDAEEEALLGTLFADNRLAAKKSEDEEDEDSEDEDEGGNGDEDEGGSEDEDAEDEDAGEGDKESKAKGKGKKAAQKPRAKKASKGAQRLGGVQRTASSDSDVKELEKLWPSAPDVKNVFG